MAMRALNSVAYDDYERFQRSGRRLGMPDDDEGPEFPPNLQFSISSEDLKKAGGEGGDIDDVMHFAAMGEVTSLIYTREMTRIELKVEQFAGDDGKFFDLTTPAHICLCGPELEKMDIEADCDVGDMIHLIGMVRHDGRSNTEYGGDMVMLQITHLDAAEDESTESREG